VAVTQTLTVYRGEQAAINFTMAPVEDITGWSLKFTVAKKANSATKLISVTPVILSGPAGTFRVTLTEENLDLNPATYFFDVWRVDEGFEQVLAIGSFVVSATARVPPL
jgi:hypothetical protein